MTIAIFLAVAAALSVILTLPLAEIPPAAVFACGAAHGAIWAWLVIEVRA